ncbi:MAG: Rpn family recombination-promoting nuclease/putative transposase [Lachnospiraceae bacterium]|nr:Rpn family recombination-promoting nuclease/putative transposase [Lachnospiraceae bacterium]
MGKNTVISGKKAIISAKYDFSFKELMSNETVRKYFISDILDIPVKKIRSVRLMNTFLRKRYRKHKLGILDVLVELNDRIKINIEMQVVVYDHWDRRSLFYLAKMYVEELHTGEDYQQLKRCIHVSILDFNLTDDEEYHSVYRLRDAKGREYSDAWEIHVIELNKKLSGKDRIDDWIALFNAQSEEELDMLSGKSLGLQEAVRELKEMSMTKRMRLRYEAHQKELRDRNARESYVRKEGMEQGIEQGQEEMLIRFLKNGGTEKQACQMLQATEEQLEKARRRL